MISERQLDLFTVPINQFVILPMNAHNLSESRNIFQQGDDFIFVDVAGTGTLAVPQWYMHLCLEYSKKMCAVVYKKYLDPPLIGYDIIAYTYNTEHGITTNFSRLDNSECCSLCMFPKPSPYMFFRKKPPLPPITDAQLCQQALAEAFANGELSKHNQIQNSIKERQMKWGKGNLLRSYAMLREKRTKWRRGPERNVSPEGNCWRGRDDDSSQEQSTGPSSCQDAHCKHLGEAEDIAHDQTSTEKEIEGDHMMDNSLACHSDEE